MNRLAGKVAIVTGGSLGLGKAIVERMAEEGCKVAILDVLEDQGKALEVALWARGLNAKYWSCDIAKEDQVASVFDAVVGDFGRLDIVVNNAGVSGASKPTHEIT